MDLCRCLLRRSAACPVHSWGLHLNKGTQSGLVLSVIADGSGDGRAEEPKSWLAADGVGLLEDGGAEGFSFTH